MAPRHPWWTWPARRWRALRLLRRLGASGRAGRDAECLDLCAQAEATCALARQEEAALALARGQALVRVGRHDEAIAALEPVLTRPDLPAEPLTWVHHALAGALAQRGDFTASLAHYEQVSQARHPRVLHLRANALLNSGRVALYADQPEVVVTAVTRLLDEGLPLPKDHLAQALRDRAQAWERLGRSDRALDDLTRVVARPTGAPPAAVTLALLQRARLCVETQDWDRVLADTTRVLDHLPPTTAEDRANALGLRAFALIRLERPAEALADVTLALDEPRPVSPEVRAWLLANAGWARYLLGDCEGFLADTQAALALSELSPTVHFNLGLALLACGRDEEALAAYQTALRQPAAEQRGRSAAAAALDEVVSAVGHWLDSERARPVRDLLEGR